MESIALLSGKIVIAGNGNVTEIYESNAILLII